MELTQIIRQVSKLMLYNLSSIKITKHSFKKKAFKTAIFILSPFDLARQIGKSVRLNLTIYKTFVQSDFNRTQVYSLRALPDQRGRRNNANNVG
jgi:hypothetical protein